MSYYNYGPYTHRPECQHPKQRRLGLMSITKTKHQRNCTWWIECLACGERLPLGPANDGRRPFAKAVRIEKRAAELSRAYVDGRHDVYVGDEWYGRLDADGTRSGVTEKDIDAPRYWAGWLSAAIADKRTP